MINFYEEDYMRLKKNLLCLGLLCLGIIPFIFSGCSPTEVTTVPSHIENLAGRANLIFTGTVKELNAVTMPIITASAHNVIVTVNKVIKATGPLRHYTGKEITVHLREPGKLQEGQQLIFFAQDWLYGKSIAVRELGKLRIENDLERKESQVAAGMRNAEEKALLKQIAAADLVLAGKVVKVEQLKIQRKQKFSEHDPMWHRAVIKINTLVRGNFSSSSINVLFPASMDVMWYKAPKFKVNQERVWLLHKDQLEKLKIKGIRGYSTLNPENTFPMSRLSEIIRLSKKVK
jgi:hypothetical protein